MIVIIFIVVQIYNYFLFCWSLDWIITFSFLDCGNCL